MPTYFDIDEGKHGSQPTGKSNLYSHSAYTLNKGVRPYVCKRNIVAYSPWMR